MNARSYTKVLVFSKLFATEMRRAREHRCGYVVAQASGKEAVIHAYAACKPVLVPR
ncbi:MAG: hypothetical protein II722_05830 [Ruminococcus sp.]|nr:hypothetical protein [Ruminococcus sp.]